MQARIGSSPGMMVNDSMAAIGMAMRVGASTTIVGIMTETGAIMTAITTDTSY
jgi:hypothetical protein